MARMCTNLVFLACILRMPNAQILVGRSVEWVCFSLEEASLILPSQIPTCVV